MRARDDSVATFENAELPFGVHRRMCAEISAPVHTRPISRPGTTRAVLEFRMHNVRRRGPAFCRGICRWLTKAPAAHSVEYGALEPTVESVEETPVMHLAAFHHATQVASNTPVEVRRRSAM
jgi:hypothetical protein